MKMPKKTNMNDINNLAKGGIAVANPPNFSFEFARWQHKTDDLVAICNFMFRLKVRPQIFPFPE